MQHDNWLRAVAFSPDGQTMLTGCGGLFIGYARLWDATTGAPRGQPMQHDGSVCAVAFSSDDQTIVTGHNNKPAWRWDVSPAAPDDPELIDAWCRWATGSAFDDQGRLFNVDRATTDEALTAYLARGGCWWQRLALDDHLRLAADAEHARHWFAASFHLTRLMALSKEDATLWYRRGNALAHQNDWGKVVGNYAKVVELQPENASAWYGLGLAQIGAEDTADYRQTCADMLARFADSKDSEELDLVVGLAALLPESTDSYAPYFTLID